MVSVEDSVSSILSFHLLKTLEVQLGASCWHCVGR